MRTPTISFSAYASATWRDWQFGLGFYLGSHLELTLYVGPFSFNLMIEVTRPVQIKHLIMSDVHFNDFRGLASWIPFMRRKRDRHVVVQGDMMDTLRYQVFRPKKGDKW